MNDIVIEPREPRPPRRVRRKNSEEIALAAILGIILIVMAAVIGLTIYERATHDEEKAAIEQAERTAHHEMMRKFRLWETVNQDMVFVKHEATNLCFGQTPYGRHSLILLPCEALTGQHVITRSDFPTDIDVPR